MRPAGLIGVAVADPAAAAVECRGHAEGSGSAALVIHVALQDGFMDERVVVRLNGDEVFSSDAVTTRFQIGLAEEFEFDTPGSAAELEIGVPDRDITEVVALVPGEEQWVGASIGEGGLEVVISGEPFRYA